MNQEETQHSQTYGMQWKQGLAGNLYLQMPIFKKKKKKEESQNKSLIFYLNKLEGKELINHKTNRRTKS